MGTLARPTALYHRHMPQTFKGRQSRSFSTIRASSIGEENPVHRRKVVSTFLTASLALGLQATPIALAENWGTRSFIKERFFEPGLSSEDAVARIRQTAEGLHSIRGMLETMSWRYVLFYIRLKTAYLSQDLKNVLTIMPENRLDSYVKTANELVDNMAEFDYYVRTPKVYESYLYYEKTLKSMDDLVAMLA
ncbi:PREDICTED: photosynthetic NDH subunit of lumenal location 2, chloroplastic [Nelumbo nucifera]|uniref:Photosynthetic NDH subunit of lumenal location 2, chloroplastic n=1 Tax=Nelumbo nucifera TaxID=4432 RepID=A0A1U8A9Q6_NELNU|nr:PREDICTED: photosynthetic NDH subunit of lumenal location 2, chloroplastic [Nelumbo nucifera]